MSPTLNRIHLKYILQSAILALTLTQASGCFALSSSSYLQNGIAAYNSGNYPVAAANLKIEVNTSPNGALAHYYLGHTFLQLKQTTAAYAEFKKGFELAPEGQLHTYCLVALERMENTWPEFTKPTEVAVPMLSTFEHIEKQTGDTSDNPFAAQAHAYFDAQRNRAMQKASAANPALKETFKRIQTQSDIAEQNSSTASGAAAQNRFSSGLYEKRQSERQRLFQNDAHDLIYQFTSTKSLPGTPVLQASGTSLYTRQYGDPTGTPKKEQPPEELVATPEALSIDAHTSPGKFIYRTTKPPSSAPSRFGADLDVRGTFLRK